MNMVGHEAINGRRAAKSPYLNFEDSERGSNDGLVPKKLRSILNANRERHENLSEIGGVGKPMFLLPDGLHA